MNARRVLFGLLGVVAVTRLYPSLLDGLVGALPNLLTYLGLASAIGILGSLLVARRVPGQAAREWTVVFDDDADFATAADKFESAATDARAAVDMDEDEAGKAALLIQAILGPNDDFENVFPMPHGYDKDGNKKASSNRTAGDRKPTPGPLRFG